MSIRGDLNSDNYNEKENTQFRNTSDGKTNMQIKVDDNDILPILTQLLQTMQQKK